MIYTQHDALLELLNALTNIFDHDTETMLTIMDMINAAEAADVSAVEQIERLKTILRDTNRKRQGLVDHAQLASAMIDPAVKPES